MFIRKIMSGMDNLMTSAEVAAHHGVKPFTVGRWVKAGYLTPVKTIGDGIRAARLFHAADVHAFTPPSQQKPRGDILDWLDAAAKSAVVGHGKYVRDAQLRAIVEVAKRTGGTFHTGQLDEYLPPDAYGHNSGSTIAGLVNAGLIEWTGQTKERGAAMAKHRHSSALCKVYRLIGDVA